jgi:subfamily B ATP-binding cassette protein MsbA
MGPMRAERSPHGRSARAGTAELPKPKPDLRKIWPEVKALVAPRKGLILAGLVLMCINRLAGLVLPFMSKPLLDKVLSAQHPHPELLPRIIFIVFGAMAVQALTSYALAQSLSKAGQRLIAELRRQVQRHVGLLPVAY